jgi:hypothetical protein
MKNGKIIFQPLVTLIFSKADVERLMALSANHYDWTCQKTGQVGGEIYGMWAELDLLDKPEVERVMQFRQIDLLAKVTEQLYEPKDAIAADLHRNLIRALDQINEEYKRVNQEVA